MSCITEFGPIIILWTCCNNYYACVVKYMVVISLDSPSCGVCLFDPRFSGCIGTLPDRPRIVPFEVHLSRCCLYGDGQHTWAGIIQVVLQQLVEARGVPLPTLTFTAAGRPLCRPGVRRRHRSDVDPERQRLRSNTSSHWRIWLTSNPLSLTHILVLDVGENLCCTCKLMSRTRSRAQSMSTEHDPVWT